MIKANHHSTTTPDHREGVACLLTAATDPTTATMLYLPLLPVLAVTCALARTKARILC